MENAIQIENLLSSLNKQQKNAVINTDGPCLILAGAGTGKTKTLMSRIAYIVLNGIATTDQILALTFTNKAAIAMNNKLSIILGYQINRYNIWMGTFHSICARILRSHHDISGLSYGFAIINQDDQQRLVKKILQEQNINTEKYSPKLVINNIENWKGKAIPPEDVSFVKHSMPHMEVSSLVYKLYEQRLHELNSTDFSGLIFLTIKLLRNNPNLKSHYKKCFPYVMVDEYQDINIAQYLFLRTICDDKSNICCVGDEDQSIYSWRGAEVSNILSFHKLFKDVKITRLEQNYRSTPNIINAASSLIAHNDYRLGKKLWVNDDDNGNKIKVINFYNCKNEARFIANKISNLTNLEEVAILVRASYLTRQMEESLLHMNLPYQVVGGQKFYERLEILDAIAYARLCYNPNDSLALERIINSPKRNIGSNTLNILQAIATQEKISLFKACKLSIEQELIKAKKTISNISDLINLINIYHEKSKNLHPHMILENILNESGYIKMWREKEENNTRIDNLKELLSSMKNFISMEDFLEHISLVHDHEKSDEEMKKISIMTLHSAKGLEFDEVFLSGWEEGIFPNQKAILREEHGLEEERRLAYVGITRARKNAYITYTQNRFLHGHWQKQNPSRFIDEISKENIIFSKNYM